MKILRSALGATRMNKIKNEHIRGTMPPLYVEQFCPCFVFCRGGLTFYLELQSVLFVIEDTLLKRVVKYIGAFLVTALYTMLADFL